MSSSASSKFLQLPRELRDTIYKHYVRVEDGYIYNFSANKLTRANGDRIDLSLAHTCHQVASEMRGLALRSNKITFKTHFSSDDRKHAGLWHAVSANLRGKKIMLLDSLALPLLTPAIASTAATQYPAFQPLIDHWTSGGSILGYRIGQERSWGEALSVWLDFVQTVLDLLSNHAVFEAEAEQRVLEFFQWGTIDYKAYTHRAPDPWVIPGTHYLHELAQKVGIKCARPYVFENIKYSYSAASSAIRFLGTLDDCNRMHIRHIVLHENHESVANPSSHARGLIPFCRQNKALYVERILSLWNTGFPVGRKHHEYVLAESWMVETFQLDRDMLEADHITKAVCLWISEALALQDLGMPEQSFKLILDCDSIPNKTSEVFQTVQRDATFQNALDWCYDHGLLDRPSWIYRHLHPGYMTEHLASTIDRLQRQDPSFIIKCNFPLGPYCTAQEFAEERAGWSEQQWKQDWPKHEPKEFQTEAPLPSWHELRWRYVHPER